MWRSYIQLKLEPFLFSCLNLTMERLLNESDSSMRFRMQMHEYAAKHQALVEETYAREDVRHEEWLRLRNEQRDMIRLRYRQKCDH